jgi:transcriptional regulator with XRE-family HTH domain
LIEKADISVTFLSNIERSKMFPQVETLSRITESLDVEALLNFLEQILFPKTKKKR